jgi:hypothetical protein
MISPFGIEHTISKGVPKGLAAVAAKNKFEPALGGNKKIQYAAERLKAHTAGRGARVMPGQSTHVTGQSTPMQQGQSARRFSRNTLGQVGQKTGANTPRTYTKTKGRFVPRHFGPIGNPPERR